MSTNYGIQYQPLSKTIETGRLNNKRTLFLDKQDVTDQAIGAVIDYALKAANGVLVMDSDNGTTWTLTVEVKEPN